MCDNECVSEARVQPTSFKHSLLWRAGLVLHSVEDLSCLLLFLTHVVVCAEKAICVRCFVDGE